MRILSLKDAVVMSFSLHASDNFLAHVLLRLLVPLHAHVDHRVPGDDAIRHRLAIALVDRLDELLRDRSAGGVVDELVAFPRLPRQEADLRVAVLAAAASLPDVASLALGGA